MLQNQEFFYCKFMKITDTISVAYLLDLEYLRNLRFPYRLVILRWLGVNPNPAVSVQQ